MPPEEAKDGDNKWDKCGGTYDGVMVWVEIGKNGWEER
ncbi:uncharacterized protein G2W53_002062 [Senna tora]|uniref:Uncharacterized protein n=1 Tax=Senna tora TaxID=362788 RepID=A0A834XHG6_9FABA|nr:uncharacterized protein G2W53_002062 [Senna tora]